MTESSARTQTFDINKTMQVKMVYVGLLVDIFVLPYILGKSVLEEKRKEKNNDFNFLTIWSLNQLFMFLCFS